MNSQLCLCSLGFLSSLGVTFYACEGRMPCCSYMCSCHHLCSTCCSSLLSSCHPRPPAMCLISRPSRSHDWVAWPNSSSLCSEREILTGILHQERYAIPVSTARSGQGVGGGRFLSAHITPSDINLGHFCISSSIYQNGSTEMSGVENWNGVG